MKATIGDRAEVSQEKKTGMEMQNVAPITYTKRPSLMKPKTTDIRSITDLTPDVVSRDAPLLALAEYTCKLVLSL
ncbi:unnamed protein product [Trichobilharzia regenti]|nr:unnamed protein product [Trichobilharzia regenti]